MRRIIIILFLMMLIGTVSAGQLGSYYSNKTISVTGSAASVARYQFIITAHNTSGTDSVTDIYLDTGIRSDWADVQITDVSNNNLSFVIFNNTATAATIGWNDINVGTGTTSYNIWYNASTQATSNSDGYSTFPLFDDFPGTTVNTTNWVTYGYTTAGSASGVHVSGGLLNITGNSSWEKNGIKSVNTWDRNVTPFQVVLNWTVNGQTDAAQGYGNFNNAQFFGEYIGQISHIHINTWGTRGSTYTTAHTLNTFNTSFLKYSPSGIFNTTFLNQNLGSYYQYNNGVVLADLYSPITLKYDYIYVRNYTGYNVAEPAISAISAVTNWTGATAPVASFTTGKTLYRIPGTLQVNDTSTNTPTLWNWSWGDGTWTNGTTQNATHKYTKRGRWSVSLLCSNAGGSNTTPTTQPIRIVGYENLW